MGRAGLIREVLLRPRRDGKPHQGADVPVRRPALHRRNERQPAASLLLRPGLHLDGSAAQAGTERYRLGRGPGGYDPPEAAQNRRHRTAQRAPCAAPAQLRLPLERPLRASLPRPALLNSALTNRKLHFLVGRTLRRLGYAQNTHPNMQTTPYWEKSDLPESPQLQKMITTAQISTTLTMKSTPVRNRG